MKQHDEHSHNDACHNGSSCGHRHYRKHSQHEHGVICAGSSCCSTCGTKVRIVIPETGSDCCHKQESSGENEEEDPSQPAISTVPATYPYPLTKNNSPNSENKTNCSCCSDSVNLDESEHEELAEANEFKRELRLLSVVGAFFAFLLVFDSKLTDITGIYPLYAAYLTLYLICGIPVLKVAIRAIGRLDFFNEFTLMSTAAIAAIGIGELPEAVGVMLFYRLGEAFQEKAAARSRHSVKALLAQKPMFARIVRGDEEINISPQETNKGDIIKVLPGEMIPVDGVVLKGASMIDNSAITGESIPVSALAGTTVHGGTLSLNGMLLLEASGPFADSTIARILEMVQNAVAHKSQTERFITKFAKVYTPAIFAIAASVAVIPPLTGYGAFNDWFYRGLVLLVISCPCALVISIPLGFFGGIGAASSRGILVKGANVFDALAKTTITVFDKTGTLTHGVFEVTGIMPTKATTREELLDTAALAETNSNHPIAGAIRRAMASEPTSPQDALVTQVAGKGMVLQADGTLIAIGNAALMADYGVNAPDVTENGTIAHVIRNQQYLGYITISDVVRPESADAIKTLRKLGVKAVYMLTGDSKTAAGQIARQLNIDDFRADLLPEDKVSALEDLSGGNTSQTLFVGDGANDGPVLVSAGVGVAMGGLGSQVAVEVADAVILDDSPAKVAELIEIGRKTRTIVWQNIVLAMSVKGFFIALGTMGIANLWESVFADVGVALLAVLNSTRATRVSQIRRKRGNNSAALLLTDK